MPEKMINELAEQATRPWLDTTQMRLVLGCTRRRLLELIADGEVRASRLSQRPGSEYRFHPDEPARYFAANAVVAEKKSA